MSSRKIFDRIEGGKKKKSHTGLTESSVTVCGGKDQIGPARFQKEKKPEIHANRRESLVR